MNPENGQSGRGLSRRELFKLAGAAGVGAALGAGGTGLAASGTLAQPGESGAGVSGSGASGGGGPLPEAVPFSGEHQAGIDTAQQEHLQFAAFDVTTEDREDVRELLVQWTEAARRMVRGEAIGDIGSETYLPPEDTGEAIGLSSSGLTITFGFGPTLFEKDGEDRFGISARMPEALKELPALSADALEEDRSGGDLCVQACSNDQQVAFHAVRNLARIARGDAVVRWTQMGFGRVASTSREQETPRNLMGLKDGTNNIKSEDGDAMARYVWVADEDNPEGAKWMTGGTYMVARRIRMFIEVWDRVSLLDQEQTIGRHKVSGAPIGREDEFDEIDLDETGDDGLPRIPLDAHIRLAREDMQREQLLRRGFSYTDGMDYERGQLDAGLFFICFARDAHEQFVPMQERLGRNDALNEYIVHNGSALFACPPGVSEDEGDFVGSGLFV